MSRVIVTESHLSDIANAIRGRTGTQTTYAPGQMAAAVAALPNAYAAADEGKVVSNGTLVAQGSDTVTENGNVDTTLISSLTVNVAGGGGLPPGLLLGTSAPDANLGADGDTYFQYVDVSTHLHSVGNTYVLTDYMLAADEAMEMMVSLDSVLPDWGVFGGTYVNSSQGYYQFLVGAGASSQVRAYWSTGPSGTFQSKLFTLTAQDLIEAPHVLKIDDGKVYVDGTLVHQFSGTPESTQLNKMMLFGRQDGSYCRPCNIYYCKIWDSGGNLVRHFVPYDDNGTAKVKDIVTGAVFAPTGNALTIKQPYKKVVHTFLKENGTWSEI